MRITISDARTDGKSALELNWGTDLPGSENQLMITQRGAMWLSYTMPYPAVVPFIAGDDWHSYTSTIEGEPVTVIYTDAANLRDMRTEAYRLAAVCGMMNVFINLSPATLEEHLWTLDGQYVWGNDGLREVVWQVRFGAREDDSWGIVIREAIQKPAFENLPYFQEAMYRAQISVNVIASRQQGGLVFPEGAWHYDRVTARYQAVVKDGEVQCLWDTPQDFRIIFEPQLQGLRKVFEAIDEEGDKNPYEIAWSQVLKINGELGWAERYQAERIRTESWDVPTGMYELWRAEDGNVLLLNLGYGPDEGSTVIVTTRANMVDYLLEPEEGYASRLDAINAQLPFNLEIRQIGNHFDPVA